MRLESILKKLEAILTEKDGRKAKQKLLELIEEIRTRLEAQKNKEDGKAIQHLMGWYLNLWQDKPPEMLRYMDYKSIVAKHLRELTAIYRRNGEDIEELKKDYEEFKKSWGKGDRGILHFRHALRYIKQQEGKSQWVDEEYKTGKSFWGEDDKLPWEE